MGNSLFNMFNGGQNGGTPNLGSPQMNQQFGNFLQGLDANMRNSPYQAVQQLINSGRMSSTQFEQFRQMANRMTGKNY